MGFKAEETIRIRNIYCMLSYALDAHNIEAYDSIAFEKMEGLQDLLAEILIRGVELQRKRGFEQGYRDTNEDLPVIRGRINMRDFIRRKRSGSKRIPCSFDEYSIDTNMNRILKSTMVKCLQIKGVSDERKSHIRGLLPIFESVQSIAPSSIVWANCRFDRNNASYRLLINACYMLITENGMTQFEGSHPLDGISVKDRALLYQHFVLNYFRRHFPELAPKARKIKSGIEENCDILPSLECDVMLTYGSNMLIIDTKHYGSILVENRGNKALRSEHRNQILSYVLHASEEFDGEVSGMLLYAQTSHESPADINKRWKEIGHRFECRSLDLNAPFDTIRASLNDIAYSLKSA